MKTVFLLWHTRELPEEQEEAKLIGVCESHDAAERAKERASKLPGFAEHIEGFEISRYEVGEDYWREGFISAVRTKTPNQPPEPTAFGRGSS
jgi:hypothetical protein